MVSSAGYLYVTLILSLTYTSDASKVLFDQTAVITVTYHYDTVLSYPDYVKTTTLTTNTFEAEEREEDVSGTKQTVYYVSGKIKKNIKNLYNI